MKLSLIGATAGAILLTMSPISSSISHSAWSYSVSPSGIGIASADWDNDEEGGVVDLSCTKDGFVDILIDLYDVTSPTRFKARGVTDYVFAISGGRETYETMSEASYSELIGAWQISAFTHKSSPLLESMMAGSRLVIEHAGDTRKKGGGLVVGLSGSRAAITRLMKHCRDRGLRGW